MDDARAHAVRWAREVGMFDAVPGVEPDAGFEPGAVWDERCFVGFDLPHCAAMIHADASPEQLNLSSDWLAWGTYGDDYFPMVFGANRNLAGAKVCHERLSAFMPLDVGTVPEPANAIERGLADLWRRTAGPMARLARQRFREAVDDMTASWLWELANQAQHRVPDPVDYLEMRRKTFGSDMTISLSRLAHWEIIPVELYQTRVLRELENSAQDYACLANDLFSYQKEIEFEGEIHNLVVVVENFLEVDRWQARDVVVDLMGARLRQFEHVVADELPQLFDEFSLDEPARQVLTRHADGLKDWMAGILEWHRRCVRYTEARPRRWHVPGASVDSSAHSARSDRSVGQRLAGPTGLGTSAARIASRLSARTSGPVP